MKTTKLKEIYDLLGGAEEIGTTGDLAEAARKKVGEILAEERKAHVSLLKMWLAGILTGAVFTLILVCLDLLVRS